MHCAALHFYFITLFIVREKNGHTKMRNTGSFRTLHYNARVVFQETSLKIVHVNKKGTEKQTRNSRRVKAKQPLVLDVCVL